MIRAAVTVLADVTPRPVRWLWQSRIPLGAITMLDGDPGLGKSTVLLDLAARLSRGREMPDGSRGIGPAATVIMSAEDDLERVIRPRLDAAGADLNRIVSASADEGDLVRAAEITSKDMPALDEAIETSGAKLLIIDPLMAYLPGNVNSNRDQDVRRALVLLKDLSERHEAAIVVVRHLNKALGGPALYRGGGSIGIIGAARAGLLLAPDPDAPKSGRVLAMVKSNYAEKAPTIRFRLTQETEATFARVEWGSTCDLTPAQLLAAEDRPRSRGALVAAKEFLREELAEGPVPALDVEAGAMEAGISRETLRRARRDLGVLAMKIGRPTDPDQHWVWTLIDSDEAARPASKTSISTVVDPLRVPGEPIAYELSISSKEVNGTANDPLRGVDQETQSEPETSADAPTPRGTNQRNRVLTVPFQDDSGLVVASTSIAVNLSSQDAADPKEVNSPSPDLLRASAIDDRGCDGLEREEGQEQADERLRMVDQPIGVGESACEYCDGTVLRWSFGTVCTSCRHRNSEPSSARAHAS